MPSLPDIPGKSVITGVTKRTRAMVGAAGTGALAVGGFVAKRVLGHGGGDEGAASADPLAETPTAPPGAEEKPVPKAKTAKPKAAKPRSAPKPKAKAKPAPKSQTDAGSTSEPSPEQDSEVERGGKPPRRGNLDD